MLSLSAVNLYCVTHKLRRAVAMLVNVSLVMLIGKCSVTRTYTSQNIQLPLSRGYCIMHL